MNFLQSAIFKLKIENLKIENEMKRYKRKSCSHKGMALLVVLFLVMAIAIISSGFIARSDATLVGSRNGCIRNEVDYAAWGGLEVAWALVQSPGFGSMTFPLTAQQLDASSAIYYDLTIGSPVSNMYPVQCSAYQRVNAEIKARSVLSGTLMADPNEGQAYYISIRRQ